MKPGETIGTSLAMALLAGGAMPGAHTFPGYGSVLTGDYRARGVVALSAEPKTFFALETRERPLTLMLLDDDGTLDDFTDDAMVFCVGEENIPSPDTRKKHGWVSYEFAVPSDSPALPGPRTTEEGMPGWAAAERWELADGATDPDAVWNRVIQGVDRGILWFHDPRYFAIMQMWDAGLDNPSITTCSD